MSVTDNSGEEITITRHGRARRRCPGGPRALLMDAPMHNSHHFTESISEVAVCYPESLPEPPSPHEGR